jgi:hypothetical protein
MSGDDGAARNECRVPRKNSNDSTARQVRDDGFIAETPSPAAHFSWPRRLVKLLILKWAETFELDQFAIAALDWLSIAEFYRRTCG